jgi:KDO2-lipid IV(A) lauroyltransferase
MGSGGRQSLRFSAGCIPCAKGEGLIRTEVSSTGARVIYFYELADQPRHLHFYCTSCRTLDDLIDDELMAMHECAFARRGMTTEQKRNLVEVDSKIDLYDAHAPPTIFMGFHFVAIEVGCILFSTRLPAASLYSRMSNRGLCDLAKRQRGRFGAEMLERSTSARKVLGLLCSGRPVMLAADMDHGIENSVFVPFFGVPACTLTSVSRLARIAQARVVPFVTEVLPDYRGYKFYHLETTRSMRNA